MLNHFLAVIEGSSKLVRRWVREAVEGLAKAHPVVISDSQDQRLRSAHHGCAPAIVPIKEGVLVPYSLSKTVHGEPEKEVLEIDELAAIGRGREHTKHHLSLVNKLTTDYIPKVPDAKNLGCCLAGGIAE